MNRTDAQKLCKTALTNLKEQIEQGKSETMHKLLKAMALFHDYSFHNIMMIVSQRPDATHVAGIRTWNRLNRYVRKGEKAIAIFAPIVVKTSEESEGESKTLSFRVVHVFDISQTEGEPLPETARVTGDPAAYLERLRTAVAKRGITLVYEDDLGSALGRSSGGTIKLVQGLTPAEEYSVLAHEFCHELLHHGPRREATTRERWELEAESVAFVLCRYAGLECSTSHADYIHVFGGDVQALGDSFETVQRTASQIIETMSEEPEAIAA